MKKKLPKEFLAKLNAVTKKRQIIITFTGDEIEDYNRLIALVGEDNAEKTIKEMIEKYIK